MSLEQTVQASDTGGAGSSLETRYERMMVDLFKKGALRSLREIVRECSLVEGKHVCDGDTLMKLCKSGLVSERLFPTLSDYDRMWKRIRISETKFYVLLEQRVFASHALGA